MTASITDALSLFGREALRIVLPSPCVVCGTELPWRLRTASCCASCWSSLPRIQSAKCRSCAIPLPAIEERAADAICIDCIADPLPLEWCEAWGRYAGGLDRVLQAFKFRRHDFLGLPLARLLQETLLARGDLAFDALVAIPMHRSRERKRGYNQSALLARSLSALSGIANEPRLLAKSSENRTQSTLSRAERTMNVRHAFRASERADGRSILIVDDICTTGETLRACAGALLKAGARRVCAVTVAKSV